MNNALTRSVTWKLNILVLFWLLLMIVAIGFFSFRHERRAMYAEMNQTVSQIARRLQHNLIQPVWEYNYEQVNLLIELEMSYPHLYAILFEDREGVLKAGKVKTQEEDVMPYDEANDLEHALDASFRHSNVEIRQDDYVMGHAQIYLSDAFIRRQLSELLQGLALQLFLLFGTLYLALFFSLRLVILRPIAFIDRAVRQMADKDFRVRIPALAGDELGRLADNFNRMAETIVDYGEGLEEKVRERTLELEQANKELEQANLYQSRFFANISHEFRTPLTLILGPVDAISSGVYGEELPRDHDVFHTMYQNGARLLKLINNILDFSKIEAGKMQVSKTRASIAHLLDFYVSTIKTAAAVKDIDIFFHNNADDDVPALVDQDLFEKAIFNLLSNACKFTPEGGRVLVQLDADAEAGTFSVSVKDSGIGIPQEKLELIFDRFQQVKQEHQQRNEGTGIGLALSREIAHLHQGEIRVKSRVGHGSTFTLTFPRDLHLDSGDARPKYLPDAVRDMPVCWMGNRSQKVPQKECSDSRPAVASILVVDDAADMREFLISVLSDRYLVFDAANGQEGLQRAREHLPDLIITDVMMPKMDGYELAETLREHAEFDGIPILFVSAMAEETSRIRGFEQGANDYIVKPFHPQELQARVKANLEMKRLRDRVIQQKQQLEDAFERKTQAYQQLEDTERRFRRLADLLPSVVVEIDLQGHVLYLNQAGQKFFEISADVCASGMYSLVQHVRSDERTRFQCEIDALIDNGDSALSQYTFLDSKHRQRVALLKGAPIFQQQQIAGLRLAIVEVHASLNLLIPPDDDFYTRYQLTKREQEVLEELIKGLKNKEIGERLYITEITVKKHVSNILQKTQSKNRDELLEVLKNVQS